jgi:hypothetical protein
MELLELSPLVVDFKEKLVKNLKIKRKRDKSGNSTNRESS